MGVVGLEPTVFGCHLDQLGCDLEPDALALLGYTPDALTYGKLPKDFFPSILSLFRAS